MIRLGPGGTGGLGYSEGLRKIKEIGLSALECEFTYGVRMSNSEAKEVGRLAKKLGIMLSVHAPYYINLASFEKEKARASVKRILQSCERGHFLGAKYIVFHPGFYQKRDKKEIYDTISNEIGKLNDFIKENGWGVVLAPETTGKASQFGDLAELMQLKKDVKCELCVDFAHIRARNNGRIDYDDVFDKLESVKHIHSHFSGIEWTAKGERRHLIMQKKDLLPLMKQIVKRKKDITIINESPDPIGDSVKTKKIIEEIKR